MTSQAGTSQAGTSQALAGRAGRAKRVTLWVLGLGYVAVLIANLPGHLSYDSIIQLGDGRAGRFHTWHPPVMAWLMGFGDGVLPGQEVFMAADAALMFGALVAWVGAARRVGWATPVVALAFALSPLVLIYQGIVWKDVLFANATAAGFLALGQGARAGWSRPARGAWTGSAFVLFGLAGLVRQNGIVVPVIGALTLGVILMRQGAGRNRRRAAVIAGLALLATAAGAFAAESWLMARRVDAPGPAAQFETLQHYDIIGAVAHAPTLDLSQLKSPALEARVRKAARTVYSPERVDTLSQDDGLEDEMSAAAPAVAAQWREIVTRHPWPYLAHRWDVFRWSAFPPVLTRCVPVYVGVDGPPELMKPLGLNNLARPQDTALRAYAARFYPTPLFAHGVYAIVALCVAAWLLLRRRRGEDVAVAGLQLAALAFAATFAVIGIACDYRYLYALDLAAMIGVLHLALGPPTDPVPRSAA